MGSLNKVTLIGRLGADPVLRFLPPGAAVTNFSLATNDPRSDGEAGYVVTTEWHQISILGKQAEVASKHLKKGDLVYIDGKLRSYTWTDQEGVKRKSWRVLASRMQMLGKPSAWKQGVMLTREDATEMAWLDAPPLLAGTSDSGAFSSGTDEDLEF